MSEGVLDFLESAGCNIVPVQALILPTASEHGVERGQLLGKVRLEPVVEGDKADELSKLADARGQRELSDNLRSGVERANSSSVHVMAQKVKGENAE